MRGTIGRRAFSNPNYHQHLTSISNRASYVIPSSSSPFSTSSSSGGGRGRGGGGGSGRPGSSFIDFISPPGKTHSEESSRDSAADSPSVGVGRGRGRGTPLSSDPILPSFSAFVSQTGSGRGRVTSERVAFTHPPPSPMQPKQPVFVKKKDETETESESESSAEPPTVSIQSTNPVPPSITPSSFSALSDLSGAGRGKPMKKREPASQAKEENRHIRVARKQPQQQQQKSPTPALSQEDAVKKAMGILAKRSENDASGMEEGEGEGGTGRGRSRRRGRGRRETEFTKKEELDEDIGNDFFLGNNADGEKLAQAIGSENMNKLVEGFEEVCSRVLPSPMEDAYVEAFGTNCAIECEPEYIMEFDSNPDIDEEPIIPLRDALEKMKPFLMAYEGIQSHEEWEDVIKETMERVPLLQDIVDYYSGPDRVTAKKQQEELERVAKTIPQSAPASVKHFANRAVLSLQNNPGWGFDKKCQFMDKLVREVSQQYK